MDDLSFEPVCSGASTQKAESNKTLVKGGDCSAIHSNLYAFKLNSALPLLNLKKDERICCLGNLVSHRWPLHLCCYRNSA